MKIYVGINYPWNNYGWDFGNPPPGWNNPDWKLQVENDIKEAKILGISIMRWFILGDGLTYGTGIDSPSYHLPEDKYHFDPPLLSTYPKIKSDFEWVLQTFRKYGMKLIPSLLDFHCCDNGISVSSGYVKGGRFDIMIYVSKRTALINNLLNPLLDLSSNYKDVIYAWEVMNEPELALNTSNQQKIDFVYSCINAINKKGFISTVGFQKYTTIDSWNIKKVPYLGIKLLQYHYYPENMTEKIPYATSSTPCIIGEFETGKTRKWPDIISQSMYDKLKLIEHEGYSVALPWSMRGKDDATNWSQPTKDSIFKYIHSK